MIKTLLGIKTIDSYNKQNYLYAHTRTYTHVHFFFLLRGPKIMLSTNQVKVQHRNFNQK